MTESDQEYDQTEARTVLRGGLRGYLPALLREMDEWFADPIGSGLAPAVDIEETDDAYIVTAEVPGFAKSDIEIELVNNVLTLRGKKVKKEGRRFLRRERIASVSEFERTISLPADVAPDRAAATFANGEVIVTLPKAKAEGVRKIAIH